MKNMISNSLKKINSKAAFTLAEALVAMLIMLLVSGIVAAGIPVAKNAYDNVVIASNAEVLLSTAMSELKNELATAKDIEINKDNKKEISFYTERYGTVSTISVNDTEGIEHEIYAKDDLLDNFVDGSTKQRLVSSAASSDNLIIKYDSVSYDYENNIISFKNLAVIKDSNKTTQAKRETYSIRVFG